MAGGVGGRANGKDQSEAMRRALELLREALAGPEVRKFTVNSNSGRGTYELEVDAAGDIVCSCPGFGYRGTCSHARKLGEALVGGGEPLHGIAGLD